MARSCVVSLSHRLEVTTSSTEKVASLWLHFFIAAPHRYHSDTIAEILPCRSPHCHAVVRGLRSILYFVFGSNGSEPVADRSRPSTPSRRIVTEGIASWHHCHRRRRADLGRCVSGHTPVLGPLVSDDIQLLRLRNRRPVLQSSSQCVHAAQLSKVFRHVLPSIWRYVLQAILLHADEFRPARYVLNAWITAGRDLMSNWWRIFLWCCNNSTETVLWLHETFPLKTKWSAFYKIALPTFAKCVEILKKARARHWKSCKCVVKGLLISALIIGLLLA